MQLTHSFSLIKLLSSLSIKVRMNNDVTFERPNVSIALRDEAQNNGYESVQVLKRIKYLFSASSAKSHPTMMSILKITTTFVSIQKHKYVSDKYDSRGTVCRSA